MKIEDCIFLLEDYCGVPIRQVREISSLLNKIDVPEKSIEELEVPEWRSSVIIKPLNRSIYFHGDAGTGKTLAAIKLMLNSLFQNKHTKYVINKLDELNENFDPYYVVELNHLFIRVPDLLSNIRETFNRKTNPDYEVQETERSLIKKYSNIDFLVLDDFGAEKVTDWTFSVLYLIIDNRYNNYKKTIITSNNTLNQLAEKLGDDRIPSRIRAMCSLVRMSGEDKRK